MPMPVPIRTPILYAIYQYLYQSPKLGRALSGRVLGQVHPERENEGLDLAAAEPHELLRCRGGSRSVAQSSNGWRSVLLEPGWALDPQ